MIALVPDTWGNVWMPRQHVLTRLAQYFHVVWVDPAKPWRQLWLPAPNQPKPLDPAEPDAPGFAIYRPGRFLPLLYKPRFGATLTARLRLQRAASILRARGVRRIVLYLWRPEFGDALDMVRHEASFYHIDDEYTFSTVEKPLDEGEVRVIRRADRVIIHSPALFEKKGHLNPHTSVVPNGVDYDAFATPRPKPADLAAVPHPRVGYVGVIKEQLDLDLLARLAERHAGWNFVFVGPNHARRAAAMQRLMQLRNVYFLGGKPVSELGAYTQHMDVAIMPYMMNDYTKFIYPLKLHEYLASGRPVVASPICSLQRFRGVAALVQGDEDWSAALSDGLSGAQNSAAAIAKRQRVARTYDWNALVLEIANTFAAQLGLPSF